MRDDDAMDLTPTLTDLTGRIHALRPDPGERLIIGIVGAPGAGKSTLARALTAALNDQAPGSAVQVPMDGFHLADVQLDRLGLRQVKGAPPTFDSDGYAVLLERLRGAVSRVGPCNWSLPLMARVSGLPSYSLVKSVKLARDLW